MIHSFQHLPDMIAHQFPDAVAHPDVMSSLIITAWMRFLSQLLLKVYYINQ